MGKTATELVAAVKVRCAWPTTNAPFTDAEILAIADDELAGDAFPLVMSSGGDYYLSTKDYTIVAGQRLYRLPDRAYGGVADVLWGDDDATDDEFVSLATIKQEDRGRWSTISAGTAAECRHYLDSDMVGLWPTPATARGTLRVRFWLHPSRLVLITSTSVAALTSASYSGTTQTIGYSSGQLNPDGLTCDIVSAGNAHSALVVDQTMTAGVGDTNTFTSASNPLVAVGDYVALASYTPILQLPDFMQPYFVRRVAGACLIAASDRQGGAAELDAAAQLLEKAQSASKPRNQAEPQTIVRRNSPLRVRGGAWGW